jgi:ribosomal protein L37E
MYRDHPKCKACGRDLEFHAKRLSCYNCDERAAIRDFGGG